MKNEYRNKNTRGIIIGIAVAIFLILLLFLISVKIVPTGYTGVKSTFGQINEEPVYGFQMRVPFIQKIEKVNNKQQDIESDSKIWSETSERTAIYYENITVTYRIEPAASSWIYSNVDNYKKNLVTDGMISSAVKAASKQYDDVDATNRGIIEEAIQKELQKSFDKKYGPETVTVNRIIVGNVDFDESYNKAIEERNQEKIAAEKQEYTNKQNLAKAEGDAATAKAKAEGDAMAAKIKAEGDAEAAKIKAEGEKAVKIIEAEAEAEAIKKVAEAQAEANKLISETITEMIIKEKAIEKWNGQQPYIVGQSNEMLYDVTDILPHVEQNQE